MEHIVKTYGPVKALDDVHLRVGRAEIVGLVGDNAAGKSTLMKILSGAVRPDSGEIYIDGKRVEHYGPSQARDLGVEMVYQDFALAPNLDVVSNIFLGREITGPLGILKRGSMKAKSKEALASLNVKVVDSDVPVKRLSGGQQQAVAISRVVLFKPKLVIMDEPSASLSIGAIQRLLEIILQLKSDGISVIMISHRLPDILEVSDRIVVLRTGRFIAEKLRAETSLDEVVKLIIGGSSAAPIVKS